MNKRILLINCVWIGDKIGFTVIITTQCSCWNDIQYKFRRKLQKALSVCCNGILFYSKGNANLIIYDCESFHVLTVLSDIHGYHWYHMWWWRFTFWIMIGKIEWTIDESSSLMNNLKSEYVIKFCLLMSYQDDSVRYGSRKHHISYLTNELVQHSFILKYYLVTVNIYSMHIICIYCWRIIAFFLSAALQFK